MKHFIAETHIPKDGPLHRYVGTDAENMKDARKNLNDLLKDGEYLCNIQSIELDHVVKFKR